MAFFKIGYLSKLLNSQFRFLMIENAYERAYRRAASPELREGYWQQQAKALEWFSFPNTILEASDPAFAHWFPDGRINITHNLFDRFLPTHPHKQALIWVSNMVGQQRIWTLRQAYESMCKMGHLLRARGVKKGDRVIIYMPMIPEAQFAAWACARIGAVHSVVFGGFASKQLASRISDCEPKVVVTASCGLEPKKRIDYVEILTEAMQMAGKTPHVLIRQRPGLEVPCNTSWQEFDIDALPFQELASEIMASTDYLYILYTSGTTGTPKGIVRDQGSTAVALRWAMHHIMGIGLNDVYFAASDIGWVVSHIFNLYGPLIVGAATVLYQGKPTLPNPGAMWAIVERHKVNGVYTSPTALRAIRKEDNNGDWVKKYDTSSLRGVSVAGQRCDIHTYEWIRSKLNVLISDCYGQTEVGWLISCNYHNLYTFPAKPGSTTKPVPGFVVEIIGHQNKSLPVNTLGKICIRLPMPPSFMSTLYNNDQAFIQKYMKQTPGYYTTGDAGYFDEDGYLNVSTRVDDMINTAGHCLSTSAMEEVLLAHPSVAEAAVVGKVEELKGEIPIGFVVIKTGCARQGIQKQLVALVRKEMGAVACFHHVLVVERLPKSRSNKILRHILRKILEGEPYKIPAIIEQEAVLPMIEATVKGYGHGLGERYTLRYRGDVDELNKQYHDLQQTQQ